MKKIIGFAVLSAVLALSSCSSLKDVVVFSDELKAENLVLNTCFDKNDYVILGSIAGSSDYVYYDEEKEEVIGDSYKYGTLNFPENVAVGKGYAAGYGKKSSQWGDSPLQIAKLNAYYELIKKAREIGADTVLEPTVQIECDTLKDKVSMTFVSNSKKATKYKVTVRAIAVQLKKNR